MIENEITRTLGTVNSLEAESTIEEIQNQLKAIDRELRQIRKTFPDKVEKCTEILRDISMAVSVYLPKEKRFGASLVKEAVKCVKYHCDCIKAQVEPEPEYKVERAELFNQIKVLEVERFRSKNKRKLARESEIEIIRDRDSVFEKLYTLNNKMLKMSRPFEMLFEVNSRESEYSQTC